MTMMTILSLLLVVLFAGTAIWRSGHLPESMSAMVYVFNEQWQWIWSVWLWAVTIMLTPSLMEALDDNGQFFAFLMVTCLVLVGAMPLFDEDNRKMHNILGIGAGILSQVCVAMICPLWLFSWFLYVLYFVYSKIYNSMTGKDVFVSESVCTLSLYGCLL